MVGGAEKRVRGICMSLDYSDGAPVDVHVHDIGTPAVFAERAFFDGDGARNHLRRFGFVEWWSELKPRAHGLVRRNGDIMVADWRVALFVEQAIKEKIQRDEANQ